MVHVKNVYFLNLGNMVYFCQKIFNNFKLAKPLETDSHF